MTAATSLAEEIGSELLKTQYMDKLEECDRLLKIEDPPETPYKSRYSARNLLGEIRTKLAGIRPQEDDPQHVDIHDAMAILDYKMGVLCIETEEETAGEEQLTQALRHLNPKRQVFTMEVMDVLNNLALVWSQRGELDKAHNYLQQGEILYQQFGKNYASGSADVLKMKKKRIEDLYTHTAFYLAQVLGNLKDEVGSAKYIEITLQRQLGQEAFDKKSWANNCLELSTFHLINADHGKVHHCLSACELVMSSLDAGDDKVLAEELEVTRRNINRAWGKYYLSLLNFSRDYTARKLEIKAEAERRGETLEENDDTKSEQTEGDDEVNKGPFASLGDLPGVQDPKPIETFDGARSLFKKANSEFDKALKYYVLDGFVSAHIAILQDVSNLYKALIFFEEDDGRVVKMLRRRITTYDGLLEQLNAKAFPQQYKQIAFECGDVSAEILELKHRMKKEKIASVSDGKLNEMVKAAIEFYQMFVDSFYDDGKLQSDMDDDTTSYFLQGRLAVARLHSKFVVSSKEQALGCFRKSLSDYQWIKKYLESHEVKGFEEEKSIVIQMCELLPMKCDALASGATSDLTL
eukprot:GFYU01003601.1.p1 GENE.GFYU01003601.1~~GFYU01003601.1.p1  ORF type:complete len:578 (+),score=198.08 GFYU01003601.1:127-1860(+)